MKSANPHRAYPTLARRSLLPSRTAFALAAAGLFALPSAPTLAASIAVNGTTCTLAEAINNANNNNTGGGNGCAAGSGADTITLPANSTQTLVDALPAITSEIVIQGNGSTVVRDSSQEEFRIFLVFGAGNLTLNQTVVTGGLLNLGSNSGGRGAGIYVSNAVVSLLNSTVTGNTTNDGAGIFSGGGRVYLEDSTVSGNLGVLDLASGGIGTNFGGTLTINNSVISGNESGDGIAARAAGIDSFQSTVRISNSTISGNTGGRFGGAITHSYGTLTLIGNTISDNSAVGDAAGFGFSSGGGIHNGKNGSVSINNSTISGNRSRSGGGIENVSGQVTVEDSTISGNSAAFDGAGIRTLGPPLTLIRTVVSGNSSSNGVAEISVDFNPYTPSFPPVVDGHNLFGHDGLTSAQAIEGFTPGASDFTATSDGTSPTALADILDPVLDDNGGPTRTHALVDGSPAVDAAGDECSDIDQRGVARPQGTACDIGAYEFDGGAPSVPTLEFARLSETVSESAGTRQISLRLSAASATAVTVTIGYSDSALRGTDFKAPTSVTIPAGQTTFKFPLKVINDKLDEPTETARLTLGTPTGATLGSASERTLTITDNDPAPTVQFRDVSVNVLENRGTESVVLQLSAASGRTITVPISYSGTARRNSDYSGPSSITIPAGQSDASIPIQIINDLLLEGQETVVLDLGLPSNAGRGSRTRFTIRIAAGL